MMPGSLQPCQQGNNEKQEKGRAYNSCVEKDSSVDQFTVKSKVITVHAKKVVTTRTSPGFVQSMGNPTK